MREFGIKACLFLFLASVLSGRTSELGILTGATTGTILLWPLYRRFVPPPTKERRVTIEPPGQGDAKAALAPH